jgi:hypothetical protein
MLFRRCSALLPLWPPSPREKKEETWCAKVRFKLAKQPVKACLARLQDFTVAVKNNFSLLSTLDSDVQNGLSRPLDSTAHMPLPDDEADALKQGIAKLFSSLAEEVIHISLWLNSTLYKLGVNMTAQPENSAFSTISASILDPKNSLQNRGGSWGSSSDYGLAKTQWRSEVGDHVSDMAKRTTPLQEFSSHSLKSATDEARVVQPRDAIERLQADLIINQKDTRAKPHKKPTERDSENKMKALTAKLYVNENLAEDSKPRKSLKKSEGDKAMKEGGWSRRWASVRGAPPFITSTLS